MEAVLSTILGWLKLTPPVLWSLVVVIGLMLWGPNLFVAGLGLEPFIEAYRNYLGVFWLLSLIGALTPVWSWLGRELKQYLRIYHGKRRLKSLTIPERQILERYVAEDTRTQPLNLNDGNVAALRHDGIIYPAAPIGHAAPGGVIVAHNIQPWAWNYLKRKTGLLQDG